MFLFSFSFVIYLLNVSSISNNDVFKKNQTNNKQANNQPNKTLSKQFL